MVEPMGHQCPECGAPRAVDNTPACACGRRASDALRDARTAEQAAAEDFDPLRIRPYVDLEAENPAAGPHPAQPSEPGAGGSASADATMQLHAVDAGMVGAGTGADAGAGAGTGADADAGADATMQLQAVTPPALPTPLTPSDNIPNATDLRMFDTTSSPAAPTTEIGRIADPAVGGGGRSRGRRRTAVLGAAGAVLAVVAAAGAAAGLFSYETPSRDGAAPRNAREAVPDASTGETTGVPSASATSAPPTSASASASPSTSASSSPSPSASESTASATPTESATPTRTATTAKASDPADAPDDGGGDNAVVLRRGDDGPEVVELQLRLRQLFLYNDEPHGRYNHRVEDAVRTYQWTRGIDPDDRGVYDAATRQRLESETREP
ncbi:peptidoglycan-binding domain-containing protein [Streptomyces cadmiisoli]|uniref:peptidoglycan-binding domain-containing protein n=1 Tax=Streptomyces cadmiisoli TaxID=2184053 RepID=UPI003647A06B